MKSTIRMIERLEDYESYRFYSLDTSNNYSFNTGWTHALLEKEWAEYIKQELEYCYEIEKRSETLLAISSRLPSDISQGYTTWVSSAFFKTDTGNLLVGNRDGLLYWKPIVSYSLPDGEQEGVTSLELIENIHSFQYRYRVPCKGLIGTLPKDLEGNLTLPEINYKPIEKKPRFDLNIRKGSYFRVVESEDYNYINTDNAEELIDREIEVNQKGSHFSLVMKVVKINYRS